MFVLLIDHFPLYDNKFMIINLPKLLPYPRIMFLRTNSNRISVIFVVITRNTNKGKKVILQSVKYNLE